MITADQLVAHAVGDYILQSDWMATEKTKKSLAAFVHVVTYTLPFLFLTQVWWALALIAGTHFVIDRWRLARYVCWLKNWLGVPRDKVIYPFTTGKPMVESYSERVSDWSTVNKPWDECTATGYTKAKPDFLAVWLLIITDNILHVLINGLVLSYVN
jgi:hypothetical protein